MSEGKNAKPEPTWHKGMYGCREDMYAASVVLPLLSRLEDADARNAELEDLVSYDSGFDAGTTAAGAKIAELEAIIEQAPHTIACRSAHGMLAERCDCWKANPYRANPEPPAKPRTQRIRVSVGTYTPDPKGATDA